MESGLVRRSTKKDLSDEDDVRVRRESEEHVEEEERSFRAVGWAQRRSFRAVGWFGLLKPQPTNQPLGRNVKNPPIY